ncbi:MAG: hypothetical protein QNK37_29635 [Acidobacteriota bacterium]|nr:hypothetical protein [Acidobacteriota bacterium]
MSAPMQNPFPGLRSFEPNEEHLFFGRERQIDELLKRLRQKRFLAVVGSSGSGKSSLVRSGMIPALHGGYMAGAGSFWRIALMRPGEDPIGNLAHALSNPMTIEEDDDLFGPDEDEEDETATDEETSRINLAMMTSTLQRGSRGLVETTAYLDLEQDENLLIIVDQFEELFRFKRESARTGSGDQAAAFVKLLLNATGQSELPIYVTLTMRSDFLENCTEFYGLPEAINQGQYLVPRMTRDQRRAAITGPIAVSGAEISPRLLSRLLNDVGDNPDQLPILQHALMRTWGYWHQDHGDNEPIDLRHYEAMGTMTEALSIHAEEAFQEQRTPTNKKCAEKVFKALTEKGLDGRGIRRPTTLGNVCAVTELHEGAVMLVVERFRLPGRSFLMPPAGVALERDTILDISHESLMRVWTRLTNWVEEESLSAALYTKLAREAGQFQEGTAGLWRDPELQLALRWRDQEQPNLAWARRYDPSFERAMLFLDRSREERDNDIAAREMQQRRQLRRSRLLAALFGFMTVLLLVAALFGINQSMETRKEKEAAIEAEKIAVEQKRVADQERERAEGLFEKAKNEAERAKIAQQKAEEAEAEAQVQKQNVEATNKELAANQKQLQNTMADLSRSEKAAKKSADDALKAKIEAEIKQKEAQEAEGKALKAQKEAERSAEETRGLLLKEAVRTLAGHAQRLLNENNPQQAAQVAVHTYAMLHYQPQLRGIPELQAAIRKTHTKTKASRRDRFPGHNDAIRRSVRSNDGKTLIYITEDGGLYGIDLTDADSEPRVLVKPATGNQFRALAASGDGRRLTVGTVTGALLDFSTEGSPLTRAPVQRHTASITSLAYHPDGRLFSAALDRQVHGGDGNGNTFTLIGLLQQPRAVAFSSDGGQLALAADDGLFLTSAFDRQLPLDQWRRLSSDMFKSITFSPDNTKLAAGRNDGQIEIHHMNNDAAPWLLQSPSTAPVNDLAFDDLGGMLASAGSDKLVLLWHIHNADENSELKPIQLAGHFSWVWSLAFSPDGRYLYSGGADRELRRWVVSTYQLVSDLCAALNRQWGPQDWEEMLRANIQADSRETLRSGARDMLGFAKPCTDED